MKRYTLSQLPAVVAALPLPAYQAFMRAVKTARRGGRKARPASARKIKVTQQDRWWSNAVRDRDGWRCRMCHKTFVRAAGEHRSGLDAAHIISRRHKRTRWVVDNGLALCVGCHLRSHADPKAFERFCREQIGDATYERLWALAHHAT